VFSLNWKGNLEFGKHNQLSTGKLVYVLNTNGILNPEPRTEIPTLTKFKFLLDLV